MSSKVLLTVLTKCFLYEGYEKLSLKRRSLEEEKLKKINLEARNISMKINILVCSGVERLVGNSVLENIRIFVSLSLTDFTCSPSPSVSLCVCKIFSLSLKSCKLSTLQGSVGKLRWHSLQEFTNIKNDSIRKLCIIWLQSLTCCWSTHYPSINALLQEGWAYINGEGKHHGRFPLWFTSSAGEAIALEISGKPQTGKAYWVDIH